MNGVWHGGGTGLTDGRRAGGPAFSGGRCPGEGPGEGTGGVFRGQGVVLFHQDEAAPGQGAQKTGQRSPTGPYFQHLISRLDPRQIHNATTGSLVAQKVLAQAFLGMGTSRRGGFRI